MTKTGEYVSMIMAYSFIAGAVLMGVISFVQEIVL